MILRSDTTPDVVMKVLEAAPPAPLEAIRGGGDGTIGGPLANSPFIGLHGKRGVQRFGRSYWCRKHQQNSQQRHHLGVSPPPTLSSDLSSASGSSKGSSSLGDVCACCSAFSDGNSSPASLSSTSTSSLEPDRTAQLHLWLTPKQYYVDAGLSEVPISKR